MLSSEWHISARIFSDAKIQIWYWILARPYGCTVPEIMEGTGYSYPMVEACIHELYVTDRISSDSNDHYYPENDL